MKTNYAIVGIGGGAGNTLNNMIVKARGDEDFPFAFIAVNSDAQALDNSLASITICLHGEGNPRSLGAAGNPELGRSLTHACLGEMMECLRPHDHIIFIAGLGGGTGSGALPVIATEAIAHGKQVLCVVTTPFSFEGGARASIAQEAMQKMMAEKVPLIVLKNQDLFKYASDRTTFADAFKRADMAIYRLCREIAQKGFEADYGGELTLEMEHDCV